MGPALEWLLCPILWPASTKLSILPLRHVPFESGFSRGFSAQLGVSYEGEPLQEMKVGSLQAIIGIRAYSATENNSGLESKKEIARVVSS